MDRLARSWMGFDAEFSRALARRAGSASPCPSGTAAAARMPSTASCSPKSCCAAARRYRRTGSPTARAAPLILKYGTDAQRDFFLPRICAAEAFFCIGMSEPQSGSDLAGLRTRATRSADGWVLKGQKLWTTNAHKAHYMIALVRTSGAPEDRHQGLSQMIVDLSLPGITVRTDRRSDRRRAFQRGLLRRRAAAAGCAGRR